MKEEIIIRLQNTITYPIPKMIIAFFVALLAPLYAAMVGLFVLVIIDYILGVWKAIKTNTFSAAKMRHGAGKIILYTICVIVIRLGERQIFLIYGKNILFISEFTILFFSVTEIASILEKISLLGVSVPGSVLSFFEKQADLKKMKE